MTGPDEIPFGRVLRDLFAAYGKTPTPEQAESYFSGLEDLALPAVERACAEAKRASRFCPSVRVIRDAAASARSQPIPPAVASAISDGEVQCMTCLDTGWVVTERLVPVGVSPAYLPGATRSYASPCACRPTNAIYQARRASERRIGGGAE